MTLQDEVLSMIRQERSMRGSARLSVRKTARRVGSVRWKNLSLLEKFLHFVRGTELCPSGQEVRDAIHELQKTHRNLVSLKRPTKEYVRPRLVHSR